MTIEQKIAIGKYRRQFEENCSTYLMWGSKKLCRMNVYKSADENDKNYTIVMTNISGLSDDYLPYTETVNLLVEPDGNTIKLFDFFPNDDVIEYIENLEKIN